MDRPDRTAQRVFDRLGDQCLNLLAGKTWRFGLDDRLRRSEFGEHIQLRLVKCKDAIA
jgi:hypothetical protein